MVVKAVIFDWGGTLTPWHEVDGRAAWVAFARGYGTMACALNDLTAGLLAADQAAWQAAREEHRSRTLAEILASCGVEPSSAAAEAGLAAYWDFWEPHTLTHPGVWPVLDALSSAGLRIGVLSNTTWPRDYHRGLFERDGVADLIDAEVYSCEIGVTKPHPDAFHAVLAELGVSAEEAVFVGDRLHEDIEGAAAVGMRTILLEHPMYAGDHLTPSTAVPDDVVRDLSEIVPLLTDAGSVGRG
ncbi:MAG: HAD family hydrolase [Micropruina sp.]|nr:HAD family hydrolase [Micropruina sp.]